MGRIKTVVVLVLVIAAGCFAVPAHARIYIDINSPALRQFPFAFYDFGADETARKLSAIVRNDLEFTGLFYFVDPDAFIEEKTDDFNPANWTPIGVEAVMKGDMTVTDRINAVVRLYDVVETRLIIYKQYSAARDTLRTLAHRIADDIYEALTGQKGIFNTRIAFIADHGTMRELMLMDYDGARPHATRFRREMMLSPHASADGSKLVVSASNGRQWAIYLIDFKEVKSRKIFEARGINIAGDFFREREAFVFSSSKAGSPDLYLYDLAAGRTRRLTSSYWIDISPALSPDGRHVAFVSDRSGNPHIYIMDMESGDVQRVTFEGSYNTSPVWSPAGDLIAYSGMVDGRHQIFTMRPDGSDVRQLTEEGNNEEPAFSPDGRFIAFTSDRNGKKAIYVMTTGGENEKKISPDGYGAFGPEWLSH